MRSIVPLRFLADGDYLEFLQSIMAMFCRTAGDECFFPKNVELPKNDFRKSIYRPDRMVSRLRRPKNGLRVGFELVRIGSSEMVIVCLVIRQELFANVRASMKLPRFFPIFCLLLLMFSTGCVQRRLIVRSQPENALVTIDNRVIGRTPLSVPYVYSGTREIKLELDGYKTVKVQQRIDSTWYERFPLSLISENFAGREIRDERLLDFQLEPRVQEPANQLIDRANQLRYNINRGTITSPLR